MPFYTQGEVTPADVVRIREAEGWTQQQLADALFMGDWGGKTIRRWESGSTTIPGPAAFALRAIEAGYTPKKKRRRKKVA